jgi:hypothetical protein
MGTTMMRTTILVLLILCTAAALGQNAGVLSNQPQIFRIPDHPQQAEPHALASEHSLVGGGADTYTYARGERPLWEFGSMSNPVPLGDIAREVRKEKLTAKRAQRIFEKQGL